MWCELFLSIERVFAFDPWFIQWSIVAERLRLSVLQKYTVALSMLAYGVFLDATNKYCCAGKSIATKALKYFVLAIPGCFKSIFLIQPS